MRNSMPRLVQLWLATLVFVLGCVDVSQAGGYIEVHFIRYTDSCREDANTNKCDPMFSFCLSTPQSGGLSVDNCNYASTGESSDHWHNTNLIEMEHLTNLKGHSNPWVVHVDRFRDPQIQLVIKVRDADFFSWTHDHLETWGKTMTETVWPSKEESTWRHYVMTKNDHSMVYKIRLYCATYYHTSTCDKYCKPIYSRSGHYTCDSDGNKICIPGWQGANCNEDIDECALGYCMRGECTNLPGDYHCYCFENYQGKNCSQV